MAAIVADADDHNHPLGVHHNIGLANQYVGDPNINVFVQQADLRNGDKMDKLHNEYGVQQGSMNKHAMSTSWARDSVTIKI